MTSQRSTRNPFPHQAVLSIEAGGPLVAEELLASRVPTLPFAPVERLRQLGTRYLRDYAEADRDRGQVGVVVGRHGSGKTHALADLIRTLLAQPAPDGAAPGGAPVLCLYGKAEDGDFLALYRRLMQQVPFERLRQVGLRFLGTLAQERLTDAGDASLRADPERIFAMFSSYFLEEGAVRERHGEVVTQITGGTGDFERALSYLQSPDLALDAYGWLAGQTIEPQRASMLGVAGPLDTPDAARLALHLLATLLGRVGIPFVVLIDQFEKLVLDEQAGAANVGLLHTLVEVIPRECGLLVLAGSERAWDALPVDLRDRFGHNHVAAAPLTPAEARELVRVYLDPLGERTGQEAFLPFSEEAIDAAVRHSGGNMRRLLQLCSEAFLAAEPATLPIGAALVEEVAPRQRDETVSRGRVEDEIVTIAHRAGLRVGREVDVDGRRVDLALLDASGPCLVVELTTARHFIDETFSALTHLDRLAATQGVRTVIVVLGYASPAVIEQLERVADGLIVYDSATFVDTFAAIVAGLAAEPAAATVPGEWLEQELASVREALEALHETRAVESRSVEHELATLMRRQENDRALQRQESAKGEWRRERQRLEDQIRDVRRSRRVEELAELERLRQEAERQVVRRSASQAGVVAAIPTAAVIGTTLMNVPSSPNLPTYLLSALLAGAALGVLGTLFLRAQARMRLGDLFGPVDSVSDLDRRVAGRSRVRPSAWTLRRPHPHERYFAAVVIGDDADGPTLLHALRAERSTIVRRAIAKQIGRQEDIDELLEAALDPFVREAAYIAEAAARRGTRFAWETLARYPNIVAIAAIASRRQLRPERSLAASVIEAACLAQRDSLPAGLEKGLRALDEAIEHDLVGPLPAALAAIPPAMIREAALLLSPFDEEGLGTCDGLETIALVDATYLHLRGLLLFAEQGVIGELTPVAEP